MARGRGSVGRGVVHDENAWHATAPEQQPAGALAAPAVRAPGGRVGKTAALLGEGDKARRGESWMRRAGAGDGRRATGREGEDNGAEGEGARGRLWHCRPGRSERVLAWMGLRLAVGGWGCKEGEVDGETSHQPWPGRGASWRASQGESGRAVVHGLAHACSSSMCIKHVYMCVCMCLQNTHMHVCIHTCIHACAYM